MSELILTGDNVNEGRIKINDANDALTRYFEKGTGVNSIEQINTAFSNLASGDGSTAFGSGTNATNRNSHAQGQDTLSSGIASWAFGYGAEATGDQSFAGGGPDNGNSLQATGQTSFCFGEADGGNHVASGGTSVLLGGSNRTVGDFNSGIFGGSKDGQSISSNFAGKTDAANIMISPGRFSDIENSEYSFIVGGTLFSAGGTRIVNDSYVESSGILAGSENIIKNSGGSIIVGGGSDATVPFFDYRNKLSGSTTSSIISSRESIISRGLTSSIISSNSSSITPASSGDISSENSAIIGGANNAISNEVTGITGAENAVLVAGQRNEIIGTDNSAIIGGSGNTIAQKSSAGYGVTDCAIIGGVSNTISHKNSFSTYSFINSAIIGGYSNKIEDFAGFGTVRNFVLMGSGGKNKQFSGNTWLLAYDDVLPNTPSTTNNKIAFNGTVGQGYFTGTADAGAPADYAEYFEWNDGNPSDEDRVGYFTSLIGEKVEIGNSNIVGVVSATPAVVGDSASFKWKEMYITDEWSNRVYDNYKIYKLEDEELEIYIDSNDKVYSEPPNPTNVLGTLYSGDISRKSFVENKSIPIINPNYDPERNYLSREERKEWSPIGLLGKLNVKTSEQITGATVSADSNGMAINGNDYYVLQNKKPYDGSYGVVKILFK
jgi:hypothetical protein